MLWLIDTKTNKSFNITCCNTHIDKGEHQLWVEKVNGHAQLVLRSDKQDDVQTVKNAIDFAIEHGETALRI